MQPLTSLPSLAPMCRVHTPARPRTSTRSGEPAAGVGWLTQFLNPFGMDHSGRNVDVRWRQGPLRRIEQTGHAARLPTRHQLLYSCLAQNRAVGGAHTAAALCKRHTRPLAGVRGLLLDARNASHYVAARASLDSCLYARACWCVTTLNPPAPPLLQLVSYVTRGGRPEVPPREQLPGADTPQFDGLGAYVDLMQRCWAQVGAECSHCLRRACPVRCRCTMGTQPVVGSA